MLGRLRVGETVEEILRADLELEREAVDQLRGAIAHCETVRDFVSRDLFESILASEESHIDFLETQFEHDRADGPAELHPAASPSPRRPETAADNEGTVTDRPLVSPNTPRTCLSPRKRPC